jgi:hypothetical protein
MKIFSAIAQAFQSRIRFSGVLAIALIFFAINFAQAQSGVRTVYDVNNKTLVYKNKTNIVGIGTGVGNIVRFNNVVTVDGDNIDAVVTTTALTNATFDSYDSDVSPSTITSFFQPNINGTSNTSLVGFNIEFENWEIDINIMIDKFFIF